MAMRLIKRDTDYAVRVLCFMGKNKAQITTAAQLVKELNIPRPFLRKILQVLSRHRVLISQKGRSGGFRLAHSPSRIFLLDIIKAFQGPFELSECLFKKKVCPDKKRCFLRKQMEEIEEFVISRFKSVTIKEIIDGSKYVLQAM